MLYFSSDIHFNNEDTLKKDNRPFKSIKEFDKEIIKIWNKQVKKDDVIYIVGDFVDCHGENDDSWKKSINYVKKIKAEVILIMGNNEDRVVKYFFNNNFESFKKYCIEVGFKDVFKDAIVKINDIDFYLIHKPKNYKEGMLNLFGHIHRSGGLYKPFGFNVDCDLNHFRLLDENDIMHLLYMKETYWDKDKNLHM